MAVSLAEDTPISRGTGPAPIAPSGTIERDPADAQGPFGAVGAAAIEDPERRSCSGTQLGGGVRLSWPRRRTGAFIGVGRSSCVSWPAI